MKTHDQVAKKLMQRPGVKVEVERIEPEEPALSDAPAHARQAEGKPCMKVRVSLHELQDAHEWVSSAGASSLGCEAYVNRQTGAVHWCGDGVDEEVPEDIEDGSLYIAVPQKTELDLGRSLALRFTELHLPQHHETVCGFFRRSGAYAHFKSLLARTGQLDAWHAFEDAAKANALREWCEANGFDLVA